MSFDPFDPAAPRKKFLNGFLSPRRLGLDDNMLLAPC